jgi:1,4-alpha-glucan branching enzyme
MGGEIGQWREWNHDWQIDWEALGDARHAGLQRWVRDLNVTYRAHASLWQADSDPAGFSWIDCHDHEHSIISLIRQAGRPSGSQVVSEGQQANEFLIAVVNFTPVPRHHYRLGVPVGGAYEELLNSDAEAYGGSNIGNEGRVVAEAQPSHGHEYSLSISVPPLGFLLLKPNK